MNDKTLKLGEPKGARPGANIHRVAADILVALIARYGNSNPTPNECKPLARAAYTYADALLIEGALWDEKAR